MNGIEAIAASGTALAPISHAGALPAAATPAANFGDLFAAGLRHVESKVQAADEMVRKFALDDSIPVHQVTIALEEARLAVEMATQVRSRLVEAYRDIMNTQL